MHSVCLYTACLPIHSVFAHTQRICPYTARLPIHSVFAHTQRVCPYTARLPIRSVFAHTQCVCPYTVCLPMHSAFAYTGARQKGCRKTLHFYNIQRNSRKCPTYILWKSAVLRQPLLFFHYLLSVHHELPSPSGICPAAACLKGNAGYLSCTPACRCLAYPAQKSTPLLINQLCYIQLYAWPHSGSHGNAL